MITIKFCDKIKKNNNNNYIDLCKLCMKNVKTVFFISIWAWHGDQT